MGFDFGAFVGGMSRQISENIEDAKQFQREKDFRLEMLAEEEATKARLQKSKEREDRNKLIYYLYISSRQKEKTETYLCEEELAIQIKRIQGKGIYSK